MEKIPPTQKSELEKSVEELRAEQQRWQQANLDPNRTVHPPASIWVMKTQIRALFEAIVEAGLIEKEVLETQFNKSMLGAMQKIRMEQEAAAASASIAVPRPSIVDKFGREIKL